MCVTYLQALTVAEGQRTGDHGACQCPLRENCSTCFAAQNVSTVRAILYYKIDDDESSGAGTSRGPGGRIIRCCKRKAWYHISAEVLVLCAC